MWLKIRSQRINMDHVMSYSSFDKEISFFMSSVNGSGNYSHNRIEVSVHLSASKICEYIDNLFISGQAEDKGMLVIDKEFEERIKDVEFKTMEEFKEVEIKGFKKS